jgi:thiamine-monophosphate kinase
MTRQPTSLSSPGLPTLSCFGERELLLRLCDDLPGRSDLQVGPGDDCAVVRPAGVEDWDWLLKSDPVIEKVHFTPKDNPADVGHKAVGRVLSDIAAMGGEPLWININLTAPANTPFTKIETLYKGIKAITRQYGVGVAGGDVSSAPHLAVHVFGVGRVPRGRTILRSGAKPGDMICVTGSLGGSRKGKHLRFEPRLAVGQWLMHGGWATAMIDISDGLGTDLHHLAEASKVGAVIEAEQIPIAADAESVTGRWTPLQHALYDGEDFELLFTVPAERLEALLREWPPTLNTTCTNIGTVLPADAGIKLRQADGKKARLPAKGYEHFRKNYYHI